MGVESVFRNFGNKVPPIITTGATDVANSTFTGNVGPADDLSNAPLVYAEGANATVAIQNATFDMNDGREDLGQSVNDTDHVCTHLPCVLTNLMNLSVVGFCRHTPQYCALRGRGI